LGTKLGWNKVNEGTSVGDKETSLVGEDVLTALIGSIVTGFFEGDFSVELGIEVGDGRSIANGAGEGGDAFGAIVCSGRMGSKVEGVRSSGLVSVCGKTVERGPLNEGLEGAALSTTGAKVVPGESVSKGFFCVSSSSVVTLGGRVTGSSFVGAFVAAGEDSMGVIVPLEFTKDEGSFVFEDCGKLEGCSRDNVNPGIVSSTPGSASSSSTKSDWKFAHAPTPNAITASYANEVPFHGDTF
jgi:hypothetical protein